MQLLHTKEIQKPLVFGGVFAYFLSLLTKVCRRRHKKKSCWEKWAAGGPQPLKNFPLTDGKKHDTLEVLQAMMGVAARSCGRKCPPEAPLAARECGAIQIQVEPRTFQFALSCVGSSGRFLF